MVMDMGQHVVQDYAQPLTLHQVMVPGLEDRARTFPNLSTAKQLSPGVLCCHVLGSNQSFTVRGGRLMQSLHGASSCCFSSL